MSLQGVNDISCDARTAERVTNCSFHDFVLEPPPFPLLVEPDCVTWRISCSPMTSAAHLAVSGHSSRPKNLFWICPRISAAPN